MSLFFNFFFAFVFFLFTPSVGANTFHVQVLELPHHIYDFAYGTIVAANYDDPTPNFCYQREECYYAAYVIPKGWVAKPGYPTFDYPVDRRRFDAAKNSLTMGEVARALRDNGQLFIEMSDRMGSGEHEINDLVFCLFASYRLAMVQDVRASNCADAPVPPSSCELSPAMVNFDWGRIPNIQASQILLSRSIKVDCTQPTNIRLAISGEFIPLNGDLSKRAEFNLGSGWSGKTEVNVRNSAIIEMKARLIGLDDVEGDYSGSAVLIFEQM
ncbi:hypothetical protein ACM93F_004233 [Enterobacter ludwigii]|jgi:hypothetical protein|nr:hypothetical protein [Enterobacter asburiae]